MGWFRKSKKPQAPVEPKKELWVLCPSCEAHIYKEEWQANIRVCPKCNYHDRITCAERIELLIDAGTFREFNGSITASDPLEFKDAKG